MLPPELIDEAVGGDDLPYAHQQETEQRPLLLASQRDRAGIADYVERTEDPKIRHVRGLYHPMPPLTSCR